MEQNKTSLSIASEDALGEMRANVQRIRVTLTIKINRHASPL